MLSRYMKLYRITQISVAMYIFDFPTVNWRYKTHCRLFYCQQLVMEWLVNKVKG